ncbi:MAG TPA: MFS transporter [Candidatus Acidoferrales bacterium]|nr:MFS transporter [Candidatus Acidoferrales bacterium]
MADAADSNLAGRIAFTYPDFNLYQAARFFIVVAVEMQSVAVGWQVYEITHRALDLGLVGLAQFLPGILLFLVSGHAADRFDRRKLLIICYWGYLISSAVLLGFAFTEPHPRNVYAIYAILVFVGVVRSFNGPAGRSFLTQLVPEEHFPSAVAWNATVFQSASIMGPALGGILYAASRGPSVVYTTSVIAAFSAILCTLRIRAKSPARAREPRTLKTVLAGIHYIWSHKVVLGSISLDMFAVLLGGAVALLPVYARDILHTSAWGLGVLRSAPGIGAAVMAILLAYRPLRSGVGTTMLFCVAGFGAFTIIFGVSHNFALSVAALILVGAADMVSVVIRGVLIQIATPDEMRGRVNAVDMVFIGVSNELGEFESGLTAHWFGTVPAVVIGGAGAIIVTSLWAWWFPELRRADRLTAASEEVG